MGRYVEGDILGIKEIDEGMTSHLESWSRCLSAVEVAWIDRVHFMEMWRLQDLMHSKMVIYQSLKMHPIFHNFSEVTMRLLAFELVQIRTF